MIDANANMELSHVAARPNLAFLRADLYAASTVAAITAEARAARACVLTGMHLCGALSPKLIDVAVAVEDVDALVLCPCCLKGAHGAAVARERTCSRCSIQGGRGRTRTAQLSGMNGHVRAVQCREGVVAHARRSTPQQIVQDPLLCEAHHLQTASHQNSDSCISLLLGELKMACLVTYRQSQTHTGGMARAASQPLCAHSRAKASTHPGHQER